MQHSMSVCQKRCIAGRQKRCIAGPRPACVTATLDRFSTQQRTPFPGHSTLLPTHQPTGLIGAKARHAEARCENAVPERHFDTRASDIHALQHLLTRAIFHASHIHVCHTYTQRARRPARRIDRQGQMRHARERRRKTSDLEELLDVELLISVDIGPTEPPG